MNPTILLVEGASRPNRPSRLVSLAELWAVLDGLQVSNVVAIQTNRHLATATTATLIAFSKIIVVADTAHKVLAAFKAELVVMAQTTFALASGADAFGRAIRATRKSCSTVLAWTILVHDIFLEALAVEALFDNNLNEVADGVLKCKFETRAKGDPDAVTISKASSDRRYIGGSSALR